MTLAFQIKSKSRRAVRPLNFSGVILILLALCPASLFAQRGRSGGVTINVVGTDGAPVSQNAMVTLSAGGQSFGQQQMTGSNGVVSFSQLAPGTYTVTVECSGFKTGTDEVNILPSVLSASLTITLEPAYEASTPHDKGMLLAPKAKKEVDAGVAAMRAGKYDEAQKHFEAAYKLAPGNPDVNDLLGELYMQLKQYDKAQEYLQAAVSIDPQNPGVLTDLGQLRINQGDNAAAESTLQRAIEAAPDNWMAHWLLGVVFLRQQNFIKARQEAEIAIKSGRAAANDVQYLLGEALAALGHNAEAIQALQAFCRTSPKNPYAPAAQTLIAKLQSNGAPAVGAVQTTASTPAAP